MTRRIDAGPLIALAGALLLLVSLFLAWYAGDREAWDVFELTDLVLAALGVTGAGAALALVADLPSAPEARWLGWSAVAALVLVAATLLDRPPTVDPQAELDIGIWLALAGSALMAAGAVLGVARVSISFDVAERERRERVPAVVADEAAADPVPRGGDSLLAPDPTPPDEPTQALPRTETAVKPRRKKEDNAAV